MGAFQSGFQLGQKAFNDAEDRRFRDREMAMREAAAARDADLFERQKAADARRDAAFDQYTTESAGVTPGVSSDIERTYGLNRGQLAGLAQGGIGAVRGKLAEYDAPDSFDLQSVPQGVQRFTAAALPTQAAGLAPMRSEELLGNIAAASRDAQGLRKSVEAQNKLRGDEATRKFIQTGQELHARATAEGATAQDVEAWSNFASPYMRMVSGFKGLEYDARVNPRTGVIEQVPYKGGAIQPVTFEQALPFMLASNNLLNEYKDPEAAVQALNAMSDKERQRVLAESAQRWARGVNISESVNRDRTAENGRISASASAAQAQSIAALRNAGKPIGLSADGQQVLYDTPNGLVGRPVPQGFEMTGLFPKLTGAKDAGGNKALEVARFKAEAQQRWNAIEDNLRKNGAARADIQGQKDDFWAGQGFAPDAVVRELLSGRDPKGRKLDASDYEEYQRLFPHSPIDPAKLKWLNKPEAPGAEPSEGGLTRRKTQDPAGSPAAKAADKRRAADEAAAAQVRALREAMQQHRQRVLGNAYSDPAIQFEVDRQTMPPEALRRKYGNGRGLSDEQALILFSNN